MNGRKQRLELTWIGKNERPHLEPRILLEDEGMSYHAKAHVNENDIFDNILIHGDNLLALRALEQEFEGRVQAVYIDPPFNTGEAFGLVPVLRRSPISLCHLRLKGERADATQI